MKPSENFNFNKLINWTAGFYGIDGQKFKLGRYVFEVTDNGDGYRSYLDEIKEVTENFGNFSPKCLAMVTVTKANPIGLREQNAPIYNIDSGYRLIDEKGHVWLTFGTDNENDYYPIFVFEYTPKTKKTP